MNGFVRVSSVPAPDPDGLGDPRRTFPRISKADLAAIDRVLAGAPNGYHYPKPRLSRPLPADGSPPKGWSLA